MRWNDLYAVFPPNIPHSECVIISSRNHLIAILADIRTQYILNMSLHLQHYLPYPQIPHRAYPCKVSRIQQRAIRVQRHSVNRFSMSSLCKNLVLRLQVPETPRHIMRRAEQVLARLVKENPIDSVIMSLENDRLLYLAFPVKRPQTNVCITGGCGKIATHVRRQSKQSFRMEAYIVYFCEMAE